MQLFEKKITTHKKYKFQESFQILNFIKNKKISNRNSSTNQQAHQ